MGIPCNRIPHAACLRTSCPRQLCLDCQIIDGMLPMEYGHLDTPHVERGSLAALVMGKAWKAPLFKM